MESNLPIHLTSFVGRKQDLSEVARLLNEGRLVTLVGPAGCGKTRLAIEVARPRARAPADGAWFVDLAPLSDATLLAPTVAGAMGFAAATPDLDRLSGHLSDREAIVLLDNAEHLVADVAAAAEALVRGCPRLRLLVTSREPLGVEGEWIYRLGSLLEEDAIRLFVDRARHADAWFALTDVNAETVAQICRRLDGIPLALELCAACAGSMAPERILQRLDERFRLLVGGPRTAVARHRTMRAALEWSEALLADDERRLYRRLSVFAGDFDLEAAEAVVTGPDLAVAEVLPLLRRLVERSLVLLLRDDVGERYRLLESLREFGRERLVASGEAEALALAHARYHTELAHTIFARYHTAPVHTLFDNYRSVDLVDPELVDRHLANFRLALEFAADHDSAWLADLAGALAPVWLQMIHADEGRRWMEAGLAYTPTGSEQRYRLLVALGHIASLQGDFASARSWADEALQNRRQSGDERGSVDALLLLTQAMALSGDRASSLDPAREAIELARRLAEPDLVAQGLNHLAMSLMSAGEDAALAEEFALEAVELTRALGSSFQFEFRLDTLACAHLQLGRIEAALTAQREALRRPGLGTFEIVVLLPTMAAILIARGQPRRGVRLAGAIDRHCEQLGLDPAVAWDLNREWLERGLAILGHQAGAVKASGRRLTLEQAKAYALEEGSDDEPGPGVRLSRREIQVAGLVREGLSNRAIAERLFISERTVEGHVASVLNKLGVNTRAQIAAWVAENTPG
ncbi:MAG: LuxR C-terminal-related transcriptional regulator [Candidatus Dormibacteraeota bacterium]|nr:LuxR C-terminal-related transcriptional regulator [Candidatus Dormibacteraeota bacterium]